MIKFSIKANTQLAEARLAKAEKKIKKQSAATVQDLVNAGKEFARVLVPKDSGFLYRSIKGQTTPNVNGATGRVFVEPYITPLSQRRSPGNYPNFSLTRWMHTSAKAATHFKDVSGPNVKFMYRTREYLNKIKTKTATGRFKNINLR